MAKNDDVAIVENTTEVQEINLEQKVTIKNIAGWTVGFKRIEGDGDVTIPPEGTTRRVEVKSFLKRRMATDY